MPTAPTQERSVDPYSDNRFSSVINRLTRIVSGGNDMILYPQQSFTLTQNSWKSVTINPGICIKDDVLIHIQESFLLDFDDNDYYVDEAGAMNSDGSYYIVLQYFYSRSLPSPSAYLRIIRDITNLYTPYTNRYIFLGSAQVFYDSGQTRYELETDALSYEDPNNSSMYRPEAPGGWLDFDGGEIT